MRLFWGTLLVLAGSGWGGDITGTVDPSEFAQKQLRPAVRYVGQTGAKAEAPDPPRTVVYLEGQFTEAQLEAARKARGEAVLGQKGFRFRPNLLPVLVGTTVSFPNQDKEYHNVFSYSSAKRFDLGRYKTQEPAPEVTFDKPGAVRLFCEIHEHMRGTVLVLETPYFTVTEPDGSYSLKNVAAGEYVLVAWINEKKQLRKTIRVGADGTVIANLGGS